MTASTADMPTARELAIALLCSPERQRGPQLRELAGLVRARLLALGDESTADLLSTWLADDSTERSA
jgi:hypothetical protein